MKDKWYWRFRGSTRGPIDTAELERLIHSQRIPDDAQIRLKGTEEWMAAVTVKELFASKEFTTAQAASELLSNVRQGARPRSTGRSSSGFDVRRLFGGLFSLGGGLGERLMEFPIAAVAWTAERISRMGRWGWIAISLALFMSICVGMVVLASSRNREIYREFSRTMALVSSWDPQNLSAAEWDALRARERKSLQAINAELTGAAPPKTWRMWIGQYWGSRQHLIRAGQQLENMLVRTDLDRSALQREFKMHMRRAEGFLGLKFASEREAEPLVFRSRSRGYRPVVTNRDSWFTPTTALILLVDLLLIAGGAIYWFRRR